MDGDESKSNSTDTDASTRILVPTHAILEDHFEVRDIEEDARTISSSSSSSLSSSVLVTTDAKEIVDGHGLYALRKIVEDKRYEIERNRVEQEQSQLNALDQILWSACVRRSKDNQVFLMVRFSNEHRFWLDVHSESAIDSDGPSQSERNRESMTSLFARFKHLDFVSALQSFAARFALILLIASGPDDSLVAIFSWAREESELANIRLECRRQYLEIDSIVDHTRLTFSEPIGVLLDSVLSTKGKSQVQQQQDKDKKSVVTRETIEHGISRVIDSLGTICGRVVHAGTVLFRS